MTGSDALFAGSIPGLYDRYLGPLLFAPFAEDVARRAAALRPRRVIETAAGTGIVTAALHRALPGAEVVATDLNPAMLEVAAQRIRSDRVRFQAADAQQLPFGEGEFDLAICQFGVMFYPDRVRGNAEARRVLRTGGRFLLVIWDRLDRNPVSRCVADAVAALFPDDPPRFLERTPFGYSGRAAIEADLRAAGFAEIAFETVERSSQVNARDAARGLVLGSPLRSEIEQRDANALDRAVAAAAAALGPLDGTDQPMSAHFVTAAK